MSELDKIIAKKQRNAIENAVAKLANSGWYLAAEDAAKEYVQLTEEQPCWIPVSERLPEMDGEYIVWQVNDLGGFWGECFFEDGAFLTGKRRGEVTYWRYGPPAPENETHENEKRS